MGLYGHQHAKHCETIDTCAEFTENIMETTSVEDVYESGGHLRKEISHEKERVFDISTLITLESIQDAVKFETWLMKGFLTKLPLELNKCKPGTAYVL